MSFRNTKSNGRLTLIVVALFLMCAAMSAFAGVTVTSPTPGSTVPSSVHFVASASSSNPITAMRIYVDYNSAYTVNAASLNTYLTLAGGAHNVIVQAWDSTGAVFKSQENIYVGSGSAGGVSVSSPANGATVSSPIHFVASASSVNPITAMRIYMDGVSAYTVNASNLDTTVAAAPGTHSVVVQAWDSTGAVFKSTETVNVGSTTTGGGCSTAPAGFYVSPSGNNSNSGTACSPWATIAYAATRVTAGSVVHVAAGTYNGQVFVSASGTSSAHIQFLCDSYRQCKVIGSGYNSSWGNGAFTFSGSYIDVQNFDITTDASGTHGVLGYGSAAGYNIVGNYVHDIPAPGCTSDGGAGIDPEGTSNTNAGHAYIADNLVVNVGPAGCNRTHGIYTSGDGDTIVNNIVHNAQGQCISAYHVPRNQVVAFNTLDGCKNGGIVYGSDGTNGISSSGSVFVNNIITNNGGYGIQECCTAGYLSNNTYDHNLIYNSGSACIMMNGSCTNTSTSNPMFVSAGSDYHLQSSSPAIGTASTQAAPSVDYEGKTRAIPEDRGALRH